jgi:hypothetical protein
MKNYSKTFRVILLRIKSELLEGARNASWALRN